MPGKQPTVSTDRKTAFHSGVANLATPPTAGRGADQKNGRQPEGAARSKLTMLHKPNVPDQQGVRDFLTEGVTSLSPIEMNRVIQNCGYAGQSERAVARDAERGDKIDDRALAAVKGSDLDTGTYLDKLKRLPVTEQLKRVKEDKAKPRGPKIIRVADPPLDDEDAKERQVAALMAAWNKAGAEARQEFLERIDVPVFDRNAA